MKKSIFILLVIPFLLSCSTQKNTSGRRFYHETTTKYNIYFNGKTSYEEGLQAIDKSAQEDFTNILPLYAISHHESASAATSQMERTIEKCRKCIKLHSIKARPKPNPKKRSDPKYRDWLKREEFNKEIDKAWLLLGMAEFHKGDFLGSVGTFNYIERHYAYDKDMLAQCQLWRVRAYSEMDWIYEAEDLMNKVKQDDLSRKHASLYAAVKADLMLKLERYNQAIPLLKLAREDEHKPQQKTRINYILAQLYEQQNNRPLALEHYQKVIKASPSVEMKFNAQLKKALLNPNSQKAVKSLKKMAKLDKNKDLLDLIYTAIGDICLHQKDTAQALENYALAIEKSTQNGMPKARALITAADICYKQQNYVQAQPYYSEASQILSTDNKDYLRVQHLAETLSELVTEQQVVILQDSLQHLATLSEDEQMAIVKKLIEDLEKKEKEEQEKAEQLARQQENELNDGPRGVNTRGMLGGSTGSGEWYFYNPQLLKQGKQEFAKKWGNRTLEDNWRRIMKSGSAFATNDADSENEEGTNEQANDTTKTQATLVTDNKDPQFYLQQIPKTQEDIDASNELIATALYNMVGIYETKVEDPVLAQQTYEEFLRRFPQDKRKLELLYRQYLTALKNNNQEQATNIRQQIIREYPDTKEAKIASDPDYFANAVRMLQEQDSLYEQTYNTYQKGEYRQVKQQTEQFEQKYPTSTLMPRFLFLKAVSVGKTEPKNAFVAALRNLLDRYPQHELGTMAKDMLAKMNVDTDAKVEDGNNGLLNKREEITLEQDTIPQDVHFDAERKEPAMVLLVLPQQNDEKNKDNKQGNEQLNYLQYQIAVFNFSQFLIKDYDLQAVPFFQDGLSALQIKGFESLDETDWYISLIRANKEVAQLLSTEQIQTIGITEKNYQLLGNPFTLNDYLDFIQNTAK